MQPLDGLLVTAALKNSAVRVSAVADARGRATFPALPTGDFLFEALRRTGDGIEHRAFAEGTIDGDRVVEIVLPVR